jgi:transcriptional regulator with XRE-family HTH domain
MTRLGDAIRLYRQSLRLLQKDVAAEIGIPAGALSRLENGGGLDMADLVKVMAWLTAGPITTATEQPQQALGV